MSDILASTTATPRPTGSDLAVDVAATACPCSDSSRTAAPRTLHKKKSSADLRADCLEYQRLAAKAEAAPAI
jgi:hypothetical protein